MNRCSKCGAEFKQDVKFCSVCGAKINEQDDYSDEDEKKHIVKEMKSTDIKNIPKWKKHKLLLVVLIIILVVSVGEASYYFSKKRIVNNKEITIKSIDTSNYPNIGIEVIPKGFTSSLVSENLSINENDYFQNNVKITKGDKDIYTISYKSSISSSNTETVKLKIEYQDDNTIIKLRSSYKPPLEDKEDNSYKEDDNNVVNTYDENISKVKAVLVGYEDMFTSCINYRDYSIVGQYIKPGSNAEKELSSIIKKYEAQQITEKMLEYNVKSISEVSKGKYKVTVYEKFQINYGIKNVTKEIDFSNEYLIEETDRGMKISEYLECKQLSSIEINS